MTTQSPVAWTQADLYRHLQMAIDVEFFTIPLYLTAAYSIKQDSWKDLQVPVQGKNAQGQPIVESFPVFDTVFSVALQEMYHLMWICNVAKSVGMTINVQAPDMTKLPATLNLPSSIASKYTGPANLADVIDLLVAIETPDPKYDYPADPKDPITNFAGPIAPQDSYNSIGDLYHAIAYGLTELFPTLNKVSYKDFQKIMIKDRYPSVPPVTDLNTALNAIGAITEQGEGTGVEGYIPGDYEPKAGDYIDEDQFSHYERFVAVQLAMPDILPHLYPTPKSSDPNDSNQKLLTENYSLLLQGINNSYTLQGTTLDTPGMTQVGIAVSNLWANKLLPQWTYNPQPVMIPLELHVCQGLNACAGHGANGSGTMPGDGDCATVSHTCQSSNDCRSQGGCGYSGQATAGSNSQKVYIPGENACKGLAGCASPISVWQIFDGDAGNLSGKYVWCEARALFEARMNRLNMKFGQPNPAPSAVRLAKGSVSAPVPMEDNTCCPS